ncbi:MAG: hypothetical protein KF773_13745 [Deltaproteobacteria bacterium]|nr:hypothetical protein [Deltaproteobacteria bacterium]
MPRRTAKAAALLHGDFSTFLTSFAPTLGSPASPAPGMAPYLAARNIDVWGVDRRWTLPGAAGDVSDFATMGLAQEVDDVRTALALARAVRLAGGSGGGKLALVGFSHGAQLAYATAGLEGGLPAAQRHVSALAPLDWWGAYTAEQEEDRLGACFFSDVEYQLVADGEIDAPNEFFVTLGQLARTNPGDTTPFADFLGEITNRDAMLLALGQTWQLAPFTPWYHLLAPELDGDVAVGLAESSEDAAAAWLAGAPPHQSMREAADFDAMLCGEHLPIPAPLSNIRVPIFYIGAAGGVGALGVGATTLTSSTDIRSLVVQRHGAEQRTADFGHADLLFADDAPALVWQPLASWLAQH